MNAPTALAWTLWVALALGGCASGATRCAAAGAATTSTASATATTTAGGAAAAGNADAPARAAGAGDRRRAAEYFDDGVAAYAQGDFARAILAFERAYEAAAAPEVLFNLARAHDSLGHEAPAAAYYAAFLRDAPGARGGDRTAAQGALARLAPRVGWLRVRGFGRYAVDGTPPPGADPEAPVAVTPGARVVRLASIGAVGVAARAGELVSIERGGDDGVLFSVATAPYSEPAGRRAVALLP